MSQSINRCIQDLDNYEFVEKLINKCSDRYNRIKSIYKISNNYTKYNIYGHDLNGNSTVVSRKVWGKYIFENNLKYKVYEFPSKYNKDKLYGDFLLVCMQNYRKEIYVTKAKITQRKIEYFYLGAYQSFAGDPNKMPYVSSFPTILQEENEPNCKFDSHNCRKNSHNQKI